MNNKELLKELEVEFLRIKEELKFQSSLEELDEIFFIKDSIFQDGFVSNRLNRQICSRIVHTYMNWNNYLHGLIFSNPGNMMGMAESKMFDDEEKKKMNSLVSKSMGVVSANTLVGLTKDKAGESKFIDNAVSFWNETYKPGIERIIIKVNKGWLGEK